MSAPTVFGADAPTRQILGIFFCPDCDVDTMPSDLTGRCFFCDRLLKQPEGTLPEGMRVSWCVECDSPFEHNPARGGPERLYCSERCRKRRSLRVGSEKSVGAGTAANRTGKGRGGRVGVRGASRPALDADTRAQLRAKVSKARLRRDVILEADNTDAPTGTCEECGRGFVSNAPGFGKPKRFCTESCRKRAANKRRYRKEAA